MSPSRSTSAPEARPETATPGVEAVAVAVVALAAAVAALFADGEPAGLPVADALLRAGFAAVVVLAASRARRWTWIVLAGVASLFADGVWVGVALAALAVALGAALLDRRNRIIGAVVGAAAVQTLLRLPTEGFSGSTALLAAVAVAPALLSAHQLASRRERRWTHLVLAALAAFVVLAAVGFGVAALTARTAVSDGITLSQAGFDAARDGEEAVAVDNLRGAAGAFDDANANLTQPWAWPARLVPVLGVQARAVQEVTAEGANLADVAATAADETDLDSLQFVDGRLDLDLVAGFEQPLEDGAVALQEAADVVDQIDSPWLVGPLDSRLALFEEEVDDALPDAELAIDGVRVAPALFGADTDRRYFVAFTTPAEMRGLGGFMGNWGELSMADGDPELADSGRVEDLNFGARLAGVQLEGPPEYVERWGRFRPDHYLQDIPFSPDMPTVGEVSADLYGDAVGREMAGVIVLDPYALAALLNFTGPIQLSNYPTPLTAENAADILLREQYLTFDTRSDRKDFLDEATRVVFERLTQGDIPGPRQVAEVLGPVVEQGRLMVWSPDPAEQALFEEVGIDGAFPEQPANGDYVSMVTQNSANNKIDIFLDRNLHYDVVYDPDSGSIAATATVTLTNAAPPAGLPDVVLSSGERQLTGTGPPLGTNRMYFSLYSPLLLERATIDGQHLATESALELGLNVYSAFVEVPPGGSIQLVFRLDGAVEPSERYELGVGMQPLVEPDTVTTRIHLPEGWEIDEARSDPGFVATDPRDATLEVVTTEGDQVVELTARPD